MERKRSVGVALLSLCVMTMNFIILVSVVDPRLISSRVCRYLEFTNVFMMARGSVLTGSVALLGFVLGVFLFRLEELARKFFVIIQAIFLLGGICFVYQLGVWGGGGWTAILWGSVFFNLSPLLFIVFFTQPKVKEQFKR